MAIAPVNTIEFLKNYTTDLLSAPSETLGIGTSRCGVMDAHGVAVFLPAQPNATANRTTGAN